ncbi:MAG: immunoglobulin domain-containing protein [Opitutales bacterium]|nr:immunoglobulin domain-containing protein [Opitutales bacterium]
MQNSSPLSLSRSLGLAFCSVAAILVKPILAADPVDHPYHLSASSYLGDLSDDNEVMGVRVLADGTLAVAALIGEAQPKNRGAAEPVTPILLNGATEQTPGVVLRLTQDGREILSVTRVANNIRDLEIDADDNLYLAAGLDGLLVLNAAADMILAQRQAGQFVKRVTTSPTRVATLVPDSIANAHIQPGPGDITLYTRSDLVAQWTARGLRHTLDIAIDDDSQTVAHIGWRQATAWQQDSNGVLPVQISYLRGLDFNGAEKWLNYDWSTNPDIDGNPMEFDPVTGLVLITNPRFLNSTGQPTGEVDALGRPLYSFLNNMADTRGYRLIRGEDGYFYGGFECAGGNHIFRRQGQNDPSLPGFRENTPRAGGDFFNEFINTGASHKTFIGRYEPATGERVRGNQFNTLIEVGSGLRANALFMRQGGLFVDADGRLYFGGAAASGLPLPGNTARPPMEGQVSLEPFGVTTNEGGAFLWVVDNDMATRLFVGRTGAGSTRSVHARVPTGATAPVIAWGGRAALTRPMHVFNAIQPQPGYGENDGFFAVLGGDAVGGGDGRFVFSYGGSGVDYVTSSTSLRGTSPTQRTGTFDGQPVHITEYAFSETLPLNPPAPGYTGPAFFGGIRGIRSEGGSFSFGNNAYSGSRTNIRIQTSNVRSQAIYLFTRESFNGIGLDDTLTFDGDSFLMLNEGSGGAITGGHWVVRDGDTLYVSEEGTGGRILGFESSVDNGRWAALAYDPDDPLDFEIPESTVYATHVFTDVTAVGFLQYRPEFTGTRFTSDWDAFDANFALNAEFNEPPVPVPAVSPVGLLTAPAEVSFDASASFDPDGDITFVRWTSGDGTSTAGNLFTHTYVAAGNYTSTLTVWDDQQLDVTTEAIVSVTSPHTPRPDRTIASFGGSLRSSNLRFGGNDTIALDLTGNGQLDDIRRGTPFDEEIVLWNRISERGTRVYGGLWMTTLGGDNSFQDQGVRSSGFRLRIGASAENPINVHGVFFIKKEDFLGDARHQTVQLRGGDQFHMLGIGNFGQMSPLRWLVRDGDQFYVSEATFTNSNPTFTVPGDFDHGRWVAWDPAAVADELNFDADAAVFETRVFSDITAYGVVIDNDNWATARLWFTFGELVFEGALEAPTGAAPPVTTILSPMSGSAFNAGDPVTFTGSSLQEGALIDPTALIWVSDLDGALGTGTELILNNLSVGEHVIVLTGTNAAGVSSFDSLTLEILPPPAPPVIIAQPASTGALAGGTVVLSAQVEANPPVTVYQWLNDGVMLFDNGRISGAQSPALTLTDLGPDDQGFYTLEVTNAVGTTATVPARVDILVPADFALHIDFGTNHTAPGGNWNSLNAAASHTGLTNFLTGDVTSVAVDLINTGGSGIQNSGNSTAWGSRTVAPDWATPDVLNDRLWVNQGDSGILRFRNLDPAKTYTLEIASGFAGAGAAGADPGIFEVLGATGPVEGFNAHTDESLGTELFWTSRGPNDGGNAPYAVEGWMIWREIAPDAEGRIDVVLTTTSQSLSRVSLNAARLMESPQPVDDPGPAPGTLAAWRQTHFGSTTAEGDAAPLANPTGDGLPNLLKFALDLDPTEPAAAADRTVVDLADVDGMRVLKIRIPADLSRPELHYVLEVSDDLATWSPLAEAIGHTTFTATPGAPVSAVVREGAVVNVSLSSDAPIRGFYRLTITVVE